MASKLFVDELDPTESSELTITSLSNSSMPTGSVLRVFHKTSTADITVTSGTTIVTGVTQTLSPLSDSSKFLIMFSVNGRYNSGTDTTFQAQVYYGGSAIGGIANMNQNNSDTNSYSGSDRNNSE